MEGSESVKFKAMLIGAARQSISGQPWSRPKRYCRGERISAHDGGRQMGSLSEESFADFLDSLKRAGIAIINEGELRERLAEAQRWRFAFATLAANGRTLGIQFVNQRAGANDAQIWNTFARFDFPTQLQAVFADSLKVDR
jgi:hypothetical protein